MKGVNKVKSGILLILSFVIVNGDHHGIPDRSSITPGKTLTGRRIAELKCDEYMQAYTAIDRNTTDVLSVESSGIDIREFPHMAIIGFPDNDTNDYTWDCYGSLISEFFVIVSGFCSYNPDSGPPAAVKLGAQNFYDSNASIVMIEKVINHPKYKASKNEYSVALLKLAQKIKFNDYMRPACLDTENHLEGKTLIATGRSMEEENIPLRQIKVKLLEYEDCVSIILFSSLSGRPPPEDRLCISEQVSKDETNEYYSMVQYKLPTSHGLSHLVGIENFGGVRYKNDTLFVYTLVSHFLDWIESEVWSGK